MSAFEVAMAMIDAAVLLVMLNALTMPELQEIFGFTRLELPWPLIELVVHAMIVRRMGLPEFDFPDGLQCVEFFAGSCQSSQVAKAFGELGCCSLAFDILRCLV